MTENDGPVDGSRHAARRTILFGGLLAGALDIGWASVSVGLFGRSPLRMLQSIASGVLGPAAFDGGAGTMALGLLLHFTIAFSVCATYVLLGRLWPVLHRSWRIAGPAFGIGVYFFMQFVVLPLSRVPWKVTFTPQGVTLGLLAHVLCVGLPIAWLAHRPTAAGRT